MGREPFKCHFSTLGYILVKRKLRRLKYFATRVSPFPVHGNEERRFGVTRAKWSRRNEKLFETSVTVLSRRNYWQVAFTRLSRNLGDRNSFIHESIHPMEIN